MNLRILTDRELIRYADNICGELTTTPLESELLRRFADAQPLLEVLRQYGIDKTASLIDAFDFLNLMESYMSRSEFVDLLPAMYSACLELDCLNLLELFHHLMENQK